MAALEAHLDNLEAANILLTAKVATLEPCLCRCGQEEQPIIVEDRERVESSPSSYQTPLVASPNENQEPLPMRVATMREGQLVPVVEQEEIDELFQAIDREREANHDDQEELSVCAPNRQRRRVQVRCCAQVLHVMSQQSKSSLGSCSEESMGLRRLFGAINPFKCVATSTISTTNLERRSIKRNVELTVVMTLHLNLDWIASQTITRLRQVSIPFLAGPWQESILQHAAELTFMLTPDNIRGQLMETPCGPGLVSDFALELMIPLLDEDGTRFLSMLVGNQMESPQ